MAVTYKGNCNWRWVTSRRRHGASDVPERVETWTGRTDEIDNFLDGKAVGNAYNGGYITAHGNVDDQYPRATADLVVAYPPDFEAFTAANSSSTRTATRSSTVNSEETFPPPLDANGNPMPEEEIKAERSVTFIAQETRYSYFAESRPAANRFTAPIDPESPTILRSVIRATAYGQERTFPGAVAPAALVSALDMPEVNVGSFPEAEPILGTPWFRCTEVWSRELQGD